MIKSLKRLVAYFIFVVLVGCFIVWANSFKIALKNEMSPFLIIFVMLLPIFIGLVLALSRFISAIQKTGVWTFDWVKFIAIGLPSFLAAGSMFIFWAISFLHKYMPFLFNNAILSTTGGIVFGYVFLSSLNNPEQNTHLFRKVVTTIPAIGAI